MFGSFLPSLWSLSNQSLLGSRTRHCYAIKCPQGLETCYRTQCSRELDLWQTGHEIAEKSSKIVPLAAPLPTHLLYVLAKPPTLRKSETQSASEKPHPV